MSYALLRPALFALDPETAHHFTLRSLALLEQAGVFRNHTDKTPAPSIVMGVPFPNRVGLAAGLDKNGEYIDALGALGFGFIEIGTVTPRAQPGNPRPRMFRLPEAGALINRLGFNNDGVDRLVENVQRAKWRGVLGINIGKNFDTAIENAPHDYLVCLRKVYGYATYVTINISSPNTVGLRALQEADALHSLLAAIEKERSALEDRHGKRVPIALKIAPDLTSDQIGAIATLVQTHGIDAVIATNTTLDREDVAMLRNGGEAGGLSGAPLRSKATRVTRELARCLCGSAALIGVGGIDSAEVALEKIEAGADLIQLYTGLVYKGPALVKDCVRALAAAPRPKVAVST
jgi:dihydroorotate dehydrogenase